MKKFLTIMIFLFFAILILGFGIDKYEADITFSDELVGGNTVSGYLSILGDLSPYDGIVSLTCANGKIENFDGMVESGLGIFDFTPDFDATKVYFDLSFESIHKKLAFFVTPGKFLEAQDWYLVVSDFSGDVGVKRSGQDFLEPVKLNMRVFPGDEIHTMDRSFVELKGPNDVEIYVVPNSVVKINDVKRKDEEVFIRIKVMNGQILSKILKKLIGSSMVIVEAGGVTAGVRGTKFSMGYEGEELKVRTFEGAVMLNVMGDELLVSRQKMANFSKDFLEYIKERRKRMMELRNELNEVMKEGIGVTLKRLTIMQKMMERKFEMRAKMMMEKFKLRDVLCQIDKTLEDFEKDFFGFKYRNGRKNNGGKNK